VRGIRLGAGDTVVGLVIAGDDGQLLTVCENGYGKRTPIAEYSPQGRGGQGRININLKRGADVVTLKYTAGNEDVMLITRLGQIVRTGVSGISEIGRNTQGVRIVNLGGEDQVVAVAIVADEVKAEAEAEALEEIAGGVGVPGDAVDGAVPGAAATGSESADAPEIADDGAGDDPQPDDDPQDED
jgi:DNA gyrase subunit A